MHAIVRREEDGYLQKLDIIILSDRNISYVRCLIKNLLILNVIKYKSFLMKILITYFYK